MRIASVGLEKGDLIAVEAGGGIRQALGGTMMPEVAAKIQLGEVALYWKLFAPPLVAVSKLPSTIKSAWAWVRSKQSTRRLQFGRQYEYDLI